MLVSIKQAVCLYFKKKYNENSFVNSFRLTLKTTNKRKHMEQNIKLELELDNEQAQRLKVIYEGVVSEDEKVFEIAKAKLNSSRKTLQEIVSKMKGNGSGLANGSSNGHAYSMPKAIQVSLMQNTAMPKGDYSTEWSWMIKFKYFLQQKGKVMSLGEGLDKIRKHEPGIGSGMDAKYRKIQANISANLKVLTDKGAMKRTNAYSKEYLYGFKEWFHEDGTIKEEHNTKITA